MEILKSNAHLGDLIMSVCMSLCEYMHMSVGTYENQRS